MGDGQLRVHRHQFQVRFAHVVLVVVVIIQTFSGLGLGEHLPRAVIDWLGHSRIAALHYWLGHAFAVAAAALFFTYSDRVSNLISGLRRFRRSDLAWPAGFLRMWLSPKRYPPPWHEGRFDPIARLVMLEIGGSLGMLAITGAVIDVAPSSARQLVSWAIRVHAISGVVLIVAIGLHIIAGSGLLPTHRGIARSMFGNGTVSVVLAERLWPGWTRRNVTNSAARAGEPDKKLANGFQRRRPSEDSAAPSE